MTAGNPRSRTISALAFSLAVGLSLALGFVPALRAADDPEGFAPALAALERAAGGKVDVKRSSRTGLATFLSMRGGAGVPVASADSLAAPGPEGRALAFMSSYGRLFGLRDASQLAATRTSPRDAVGMDHVRLQQVERGVPVTGAELVVHLKGSRVIAVNGRSLRLPADFDVAPTVGRDRVQTTVTGLLEKRMKVTEASLSEPRLEVFDLGLIGGPPRPARLAWFVEATKIDLREFFWVDAKTGGVLKHFSQLTKAENRKIYDAHSGPALPGTLVRSEQQGPTGDADIDAAFDYSGVVWEFYKNNFGRDSYDGAGAVLKSTVRSCPAGKRCPYDNAFWNGTQMVYAEGFPEADDVDAHELTHAITERTAHLFYYMQSGALNESFSDIFGETVDLTDGSGDDSPAARWYIGEDLPFLLDGVPPNYRFAIRSMASPTLYGHPGKMSDPQFLCLDSGFDDQGGVHENSGVGNHAYALMVDGGNYNGQAVTGIGLTKAAAIEYRTLTEYLTSASDFADDYNSLLNSCFDLVGTDVDPTNVSAIITNGDCTQVQNALDAVEMADPWPCSLAQPTAPQQCPAGTGPVFQFADNLENTKSGNWTTSVLKTGDVWTDGTGTPAIYHSDFATSGNYAFWGFDTSVISDSTVNMSKSVPIAPGTLMYFNHSYGFDNDPDPFPIAYDGGVIEYSTDNGAHWLDAGFMISGGASYNGAIQNLVDFGNPLGGGRPAFVRDSWGYTATQLDLTPLNGQNVRFRFRVGTDDGVDDYGWFIDDVRIYKCDVGGSIQLSPLGYSVGEAGPVATITATRTGGSAGDVTVDFATSDETATAGLDYTHTEGVLRFDSNVNSQTFTVPITNDTLAEANETFRVTLSNPSGASATLGAPSSAPVTIIDNDVAGSVAFGVATYTVAESAPFALITVKRTGGSASGVTVHYATTNGTAQAGSDYTTAQGNLTFGAGVMALTFQVPITNDAFDEPNETVNLTLSLPGGGATLGAPSASVLTITDNDVAGSVQFSAAAYSAAEGAGTAVITVTRSGGAASGVTVNYATSDGTATAAGNLDYTASNGTLSFSAGEMTKTFLVPITQDSVGENNETVNLTLSSPTGGAVLGTRPTAVLTILEDETVLQFSAPQFAVTEATPKVTVTVKRSGIVTGVSTVQYSVVDGTATAAGPDYTPIATGTLTFPAKVTSQAFTIPILNDTVSESSEFFVVRLANPTGGVLGPQDTSTVLINDDDSVLSLSSATYAGKEGGPDVVVTVQRIGNKTTLATVHYATSDVSATAGSDYTAVPDSVLTFAPGITSQTFKVHLIDDGLAESTETLNLALSTPSGALIGRAAAVLSIADNEPVVSLSAAAYTVAEPLTTATPFNVTVKRTGPTAPQVTVDYATTNGTATSGVGLDYAAASGTLTFAPGQTMKTFPILIQPDANGEAPETIHIALSNATQASIGLGAAVLTITDNDPSISFGAAAYSAKESGKTAVITVKRTGVLTAPATVDYTTSPGTATAGSDYTTTSGTLTFAAGKSLLTFAVPILPDVQSEGIETVLLTLSNPTGGVIGLGSSVLTIVDDDVASVVKLAATSFSGSEASGEAVITVTRTGGLPGVVSVHYATSDISGSATAGSDYTATSGTLTFAANETVKTFSVPLAANGPPTEFFKVALTAPAGGATLGTPNEAVVFITN